MAVGVHIVSAFNGPADLDSFDLINHDISSSSSNTEISSEQKKLDNYYRQVREFREGINTTISRHKVFEQIATEFPNDWLLSIELYELAKTNGDSEFADEITTHLVNVKLNNPKVGQLIDDGIEVVDNSLVS